MGKVLGQGGFGITYLGSDARLQRSVAIKEFFPFGCSRYNGAVQPSGALSSQDYRGARDRFLDEARVLAQFQCPGIVHVYATFEENNTAYMVMEFLKGKPLIELISDGRPLPESQAVSYIEKVGDALAVVHQAGILHRDIKPDNLMATNDGRVVLVDFGTAREFAAGKTKRMTAMLTPGYAPLEQYGQQARFGVFTDIYALGATLYHLLTGEVPTQATDRAAGVTLKSPRQLNPAVSQPVSDTVMWALETRAAQRPQTAHAFVEALRGTAPAPSRTTRGSGKAKTRARESAPSPTPPPVNPYLGRVQQLLAELARPAPPPPASRYDARLGEISSKLAWLAGVPQGPPTQCPACRQGALTHVTGQPDGRCPICRRGRLTDRKLDLEQCAVCHTGKLVEHRLADDEIFCPLCRAAPMQKQRRRQLGFAVDLWWVCLHCNTEMDVLTGGRAKLVRFQQDPHGIGRYQGQTLPISNWKRLSGRSDHYAACMHCRAQFDLLEEGRSTLVHVEADPYGAGAKHRGATLFRSAWSKLAQGLPVTAGNFHCPECRAEFEHDPAQRTLCLRQSDAPIEWLQHWKGRPLPLSAWYLAAAGKRSLRPGLLCPACRTEFDDEQGRLKLAWTHSSVLATAVGQTHSLPDWRRRGAGFPTAEEERQLRDEEARLGALRQQEQHGFMEAQRRQRAHLEEQITRLYKQSLLGGYVPLPLGAQRIQLRSGETLRWQSSAQKWKVRSHQGTLYWDVDAAGLLVVTSERLLFEPAGGSVWQRPLGKLIGVEVQSVRGSSILKTDFLDLQKPVGFVVNDSTWSIRLGDHSLDITLSPRDLAELLGSLRQNAC